jgi:hypothetical protein
MADDDSEASSSCNELDETVLIKTTTLKEMQEPFDFEAKKPVKDSDYFSVKRVLVEGYFFPEKDDHHEEVDIVLNKKSKLEICLEPFIDRSDETMFKVDLNLSSDQVKMKVVISLRLQIFDDFHNERYLEASMMITDDMPMNVGKIGLCSYKIDNGYRGPCSCRFEIHIVVKIQHQTESWMQDISHINQNKFSDIKLICGDETFKCHRAILAARSDVFLAMFDMTNSTENQTGFVKIEDIKAATMQKLLKFIYKGQVTEQDALDINLWFAADKYNITALVSQCQDSILNNLSLDNVLNVLAKCHLLVSEDIIKELTNNLIRANAATFVIGKDWKDFSINHPDLAHDIRESCLDMKLDKDNNLIST